MGVRGLEHERARPSMGGVRTPARTREVNVAKTLKKNITFFGMEQKVVREFMFESTISHTWLRIALSRSWYAPTQAARRVHVVIKMRRTFS